MNELYPLVLERSLSYRLWGGYRLAEFLGLESEKDGEPLAESWQVYAKNRVLNGAYRGQTLAAVAALEGKRLLGTISRGRYGKTFPLLAKFIGAAQPLSIQVHPDDAYALAHERASGHLGKTEAWVILEAEPDARIVWGFERDLSADEVRRHVEAGTLEEVVSYAPVAPGAVIYNPAGTVHAIGAGILLFEIQQSSDLTYRLYDYRRRDAHGKLRDLHLEKALDVARLTAAGQPKVVAKQLGEHKTELLRVEHMAVERWELAGEQQETTRPGSLEILTLTRGELELMCQSDSLHVGAGDSVVLPAVLGPYRLKGEASLLRCYIPEHGND